VDKNSRRICATIRRMSVNEILIGIAEIATVEIASAITRKCHCLVMNYDRI